MMTKAKRPSKHQDSPKSTRASVSFPREQYDILESIAKEKKVSVAWVIRDATEKYIAAQWPLLSTHD